MAEKYIYTAGPARALIFYGQNLIAVGKTFSNTGITMDLSNEEVRGGPGEFALYVE